MAFFNGYPNWIMLNLYPERQTVFNSLPNAPNLELLRMNLDEIRRVIMSFHPDVMFAMAIFFSGAAIFWKAAIESWECL